MLWHKSWLETRWRFAIGLVLLVLSVCSSVFTYPQAARLLSSVSVPDLPGALGERVRDTVALSRSYRGYVWSGPIRQNLLQMWALFAVLLGTGGLLAHHTGGGVLFTLSLPVSRTRVLMVRAATGLAELFVLALVPLLLLPLLSPAVGQSYRVSDALVHGACLFVAGTVLFTLALLLSTIFSGVWQPLLIVLAVAVMLGLADVALRDLIPFGLFRVMSGEDYFRGRGVPWLGLLLTAAASAALLYAAVVNYARQNF
jgi:ABC-type transport system involved in multi-copper enzyme maturation permease subunit